MSKRVGVGRGWQAPADAVDHRSVESFTPAHHQPIRPLTWWNSAHRYSLGSNAERRCAAKMRPARSDGQGAPEKLVTVKHSLTPEAAITSLSAAGVGVVTPVLGGKSGVAAAR
jgi:hypothetical protein